MTAPTVKRVKLPAVRQAIASTPWAIVPEKLEAILEVVETHALHGSFSRDDIEARTAGRPATKAGQVRGAIQVLPLYGAVSQRMNMMSEMSGGTSTEAFAAEFDSAVNNPDIGAIIIDVDSPGGNVAGVPELAKKIFDARGKKPIVAVANSLMASAAYWIASAADEIIASPSADVGSIGVYMVHMDTTEADARDGIKWTLIKAGDYKAEGSPYEPLSDDAKAFLQQQVTEFYGMFVSAVAKHRGVSVSDVRENYGKGRVFMAKQALAAGMVDRIATLEDTVTRLGGKGAGAALSQRNRASAEREALPIAATTTPLSVVAGALTNTNTTTTTHANAAPFTLTTDETPTSAGADARVNTPSPDHPAPKAKENTVSDSTTAAPGGAVDIQAAVAAERKRAADIRALGADHTIDAARIDAVVNSGVSYEAASIQFLNEIKGRAAARPNVSVGSDREADRGFANIGEQFHAVIAAGKTGRVDKRLLAVNNSAMKFAGAPSGMNESVGSEGGFFIQNDLLPGVIEPVYADDPVLSRVNRIPVGDGKNGIKFNVIDETARTDGSRFGGIQMFYADEADAATAKKPKLRRVELELRKILGLAYLTDELMQDAPAAQTLLVNAFQTELRFMIASAIWRGAGANQPLGFLKSGALVTQAIEAAQTIANSAASISQNVAKMLMHIPAGLLSDVIFLYNPELLPTLLNATVGGTSIPAFVPMAGLSDQGGVDRILGRPAFASEQAEAVGTTGDIVAICPSQYALADKGGPTVATSVHVRFLNDEEALRITYRFDGQPTWVTSVTPYKGSAARSPFVGLGTRS